MLVNTHCSYDDGLRHDAFKNPQRWDPEGRFPRRYDENRATRSRVVLVRERTSPSFLGRTSRRHGADGGAQPRRLVSLSSKVCAGRDGGASFAAEGCWYAARG